MGNNTSPLESLLAFSITFAAGLLSAIALKKYVEWEKHRDKKNS